MITKTVTITNPQGFHVRPTKTFVKKASEFPCKINVEANGRKVNGKSSLSMLTLGISTNDEVTLIVEGEQEEQAAEALIDILTQIHD
jgi:phosphocarrier protein HPr